MVVVGESDLIAIKVFAAMDNSSCSRLFLDCQGLQDFRGQLLNCAMTIFFFGRSVRNCFRLIKSKEQISHKHLLQHILLVIIAQICYSFGVFLLTYDFDSDELSQSSRNASIGHKIMEIFCIDCLNCLIIHVGEHYWSSVRTYMMQANSRIIQKRCCTIYFNNPKMKYLFMGMYGFAGVSLLVSALLLFYGHGDEQNADFTAQNLINFVVTVLSILIFLIASFKVYQVIQLNQEISKKQRRKQFFYASMVLLTCALRNTSFWLAFLDIDPSNTLRDFRPRDCFDQPRGHALYIMGLTLMVNFLPAIFFTSIFKAKSDKDFIKHGTTATLALSEF